MQSSQVYKKGRMDFDGHSAVFTRDHAQLPLLYVLPFPFSTLALMHSLA